MDGLLVRSTSRTLLAAPQASRYSRAKPHIPTNISRVVAQRSFPCPQPLSSSLFSRPAFLKVSSKEIHTRSMSRAGMARASGEVIMDMEALQGISVFTADGESVQFKDLWDQKNGKAIVAFLRHFGCPFCWEFASALRDAKPKFDAAGFKLITIGVGPPSKARNLAENLPFPIECLYADPDRKAYDALGLYHGVARTWLNPASMQIFGRLDKVAKAVKGWNSGVMPDDSSATLQQGGVYVFDGSRLLYARKDESTGDHSKIDDILKSCCTPVAA
ncbi:unnamed protein product [Sphagnum troendelagicum]|uniref:Thioredoxin domain-containing protein n=1 Tax=Sphagnum troendelagicum TaxID=128251 RepID=A0ABP0TY59_9BRYO